MTAPNEAEAERRIRALLDAGQDLVSVTRTGETKARTFFAVVRCWPHPDLDDHLVLNIQNVQLTADWSDMDDTFLSGGYRQRVPEGDGEVARSLARSLAGAAAQADAGALGTRDVEHFDATGDQ